MTAHHTCRMQARSSALTRWSAAAPLTLTVIRAACAGGLIDAALRRREARFCAVLLAEIALVVPVGVIGMRPEILRTLRAPLATLLAAHVIDGAAGW